MPHHPSTCREVEESCAGNDGGVENVFFLMLDKGANGTMDDAFWRAWQV